MSKPFLDCFYSAIFLPGIATEAALHREVEAVARQLYQERQDDLSAMFSGQGPTLKQWELMVERMVIHPEEEDGGLVISVRASGPADGQHPVMAEWVATALMRKAPAGSKIIHSRVTDATGVAPGSSGWITLNASGDALVPFSF